MDDLFDAFATNEKLEVEGRWVDYGDMSFLIARAGNKQYARLFTKLYDKNRAALQSKGDAAEAVAEKLLIDTMSKTVLLDWKNVKFQKAELPYSEENAKKMLAMTQFRLWVLKQSEDAEAYKAVQAQEDEKN